MDCIKIEKGNSLVRLFNASPKTPPVDVYINSKLIFSEIKYKELTKYLQLKEGNYKIDVYESGTKKAAIIKETIDLEDGEIFTIAMVKNSEEIGLLVIPDYATKRISDDYGSFRVINLSPNISAIDFIVDEDVLFKDIGFREGTIYADVKPNEYNIKVDSSKSGKSILKFKIKLKPNRIYTIYIIGSRENLSIIQSVDGNTYICK